jgi:hypothetical protein
MFPVAVFLHTCLHPNAVALSTAPMASDRAPQCTPPRRPSLAGAKPELVSHTLRVRTQAHALARAFTRPS